MSVWPTDEQFDKATELGCNAALSERRNGNDEPRESPLSGEWADDITPADITRGVGYQASESDDEDEWMSGQEELLNAWERGYFDTWQHETEVKAEEDAE